MRMLDRIDPKHPLTIAAREVNAFAEDNGLTNTIDQLGMEVTTEQLMYLAQQRALRAYAAVVHHYNLGHDEEKDAAMAAEIIASREWKAYSGALIAAYMDGMVIGWRGAQIMAGDYE